MNSYPIVGKKGIRRLSPKRNIPVISELSLLDLSMLHSYLLPSLAQLPAISEDAESENLFSPGI